MLATVEKVGRTGECGRLGRADHARLIMSAHHLKAFRSCTGRD